MANTHLVSAWVPGNWVPETTGISWIRETSVKEESEKAGLKLNVQKTKIMASGPTISWQTDGKKVEIVTDFYFPELRIHCGWWKQPQN